MQKPALAGKKQTVNFGPLLFQRAGRCDILLHEKEEATVRKLSRCLAVALLLAGLMVCLAPCLSQADGQEVSLYCLNIGKADCMLLCSGRQTFLIDAGYAQTYAALETALEQLNIDYLDGVILTHCHKDHAGGLMALAESGIQVGAWYAAEIYYDVKQGEHPAMLAAAVRGETVVWLRAGDVIPVDGQGALTVLGPLSVNEDNENNNSLVLRFSSPQGSILFAGDMKETEEEELLAAGVLEKSDVLKVGHHGGGEASTLAFLRAVQPKAAVILTNTQERSATPDAAVLNRLSAVGCTAYVSQDARDALLVVLSGGEAAVRDVAWEGVPARAEGITLTLDMEQDALTLRNEGEDALELTGGVLYSSKGDETLILPRVTLLPGETYVVGSQSTEIACDLLWEEKRVWHKKKWDQAILYDCYGRAIARTDNGLSE